MNKWLIVPAFILLGIAMVIKLILLILIVAIAVPISVIEIIGTEIGL